MNILEINKQDLGKIDYVQTDLQLRGSSENSHWIGTHPYLLTLLTWRRILTEQTVPLSLEDSVLLWNTSKDSKLDPESPPAEWIYIFIR